MRVLRRVGLVLPADHAGAGMPVGGVLALPSVQMRNDRTTGNA